MCIILACEQNVRPDHELLETCFYNNPDGAGIMWVEDGRVQTSKGFTSIRELAEAIDYVPKQSRLVIHMRIATSGGIDVGTCHPFPICNDLEMLHEPDVECDAALMHNGIIPTMPTDDKLGISDTVAFVQLVVNDLYHSEGVTKSSLRRIKRAAPGNRFALMTKDGKVYRLGDGWESVTKGIQASNSSWRYDKSLRWYSYDDYEDYEDDYIADYASALDFCCGDCPSKGSCMEYGPMCGGVADFIDEWAEWEKDGWKDYDDEEERDKDKLPFVYA